MRDVLVRVRGNASRPRELRSDRPRTSSRTPPPREDARPAPKIPAGEEEKTKREVRIAKEREALEEGVYGLSELSPFTCPECHGVLAMLREGKIIRFRCHTGHAFSSDSLLHASSELVEARLWDAVRSMDETIFLLHRLGDEFAKGGYTAAAEKCFDKAREMHERLAPIREASIDSQELNVSKLREKA